MDSKTRTYQFALKTISFIESLSKDTTTQTITKQLLRLATSIGANIIEAQASPSRKDFTNFFNHALKSANETRYWLELLKDTGKVTDEAVNILIQEVDGIANILGSSILLKGKRKF